MGEIFRGVRIFFENRGNLKQVVKCIIASGGMDAPGPELSFVCMKVRRDSEIL